MNRRWARASALLCLLPLVWPQAQAEEWLYYVENGSVVITNTPSRADARPLPGRRSAVPAPSGVLPVTPYDAFIDRVAAENGLSARLIKVIAWVESGFDPKAVSRKGAIGLMQLMPETASQYGVRDPLDPYENLRAGARHLRGLLDEFGGNLALALAAYNAGGSAVRRYRGVPAYPETREFVRKVSSRMGRQTRRQASPPPPSADRRPIEVRRQADGSVLFVN